MPEDGVRGLDLGSLAKATAARGGDVDDAIQLALSTLNLGRLRDTVRPQDEPADDPGFDLGDAFPDGSGDLV
ncbi:hypothetical protein [Albimonas pacifica]|uniref:Uncharacterized protein n=1 Tax=Albimonas pacifica TaxID=1114924 RepID=A0A1I3HRY7_9RHOB|nr:hypothetical protein [Albimonas pacifica]SFI38442.1 hypothetical protein SAMN05216258_106140 [Albimonas pacifica]